MAAVDLQPPRQVGGPAEELLVEVVAEPPDALGDQDPGRRGVHHRQHARAAAVRDVRAGQDAEEHAAPDPQAALPDAIGRVPLVAELVVAGDVVVEPGADQAGEHRPERDLEDEVRVAAHRRPAAHGDPGRDHDPGQQAERVEADVERPDVEVAHRRGRDAREDVGAHGPTIRRGASLFAARCF